MEIYLIRHTTPDIEKGICYGQSDLDLAKTCNKEFKIILKQIPKDKNYQVYSSPLKRCSLLAEQFNAPIVFDDRLKELDFGDWEMQPWNSISENELNPWMEDFVNVSVPNGESYTQLADRVNSFFEVSLDSKDTKNIIIITHAGVIRAFLSGVLGIPLKKSFSIKIQYGEVFHLKKENGLLNLITKVEIK